MNWPEFLGEFAGRPLFHSSMLGIFPDNRAHAQIQLTRWTKAGKIAQIGRGWYLIQRPYRQNEIPLPMIANSVIHPSYLSLEWALQHRQMIPEFVSNPTSMTTSRGTEFIFENRLFTYHFVQPSLFTGYIREEYEGEPAFIACAEKALFDKVYLFIRRDAFSLDWLRELRLQNLDGFDLTRFQSYLEKTKRPGLRRAIELASRFIREQLS